MYTGECVDGLDEMGIFGHHWNRCHNQQIVGLRIDIFDGDLETVETPGLK
jgi:hypothetical protein